MKILVYQYLFFQKISKNGYLENRLGYLPTYFSDVYTGHNMIDSFTQFLSIFVLSWIFCPLSCLGGGIPVFDNCGPPVPNGGKVNATSVTIGYLATVTGNVPNRQGRSISGALSYAIEQINNCSNFLPDVELKLIYKDTYGDVKRTSGVMVDQICNDIAAFIGPDSAACNVEATLAASKNRSMISYKCSDPKVSDKEEFPTFTRMEPTDTQV